MKKVSYEAWAVLTKNGRIARLLGAKIARLYESQKVAKYYAGFAPVAKVRVTIEPVKATKKRRVAR